MNKPQHPMQPIVFDEHGTIRFHRNRIVDWMLDRLSERGITLNEICMQFDREGEYQDDYQQLMQLVGYSVSGYGDLCCAKEDILEAADATAHKMREEKEKSK